MCGRFVRQGDIDKIVREFSVEIIACDLAPSYNIAPTQDVAVIIEDGAKKLVSVKWGLVPSWAGDSSGGSRMINARAESIQQKAAFKEPFLRRRCLVVADGFYEWRKEGGVKQPVFISLKSGRPFGFAGVYEDWTSPEARVLRTCSVITTNANEIMKPIHDRMPAIIPRDREDFWLNPSSAGTPEGLSELLALLQPYPADQMETRDVSRLVNSVVNDSPECLLPAALAPPAVDAAAFDQHPLLPFGD